MSTKQQHKTRARKERQAKTAERIALERAAVGEMDGPRKITARSVCNLSTERLQRAVARRRWNIERASGVKLGLALAHVAAMGVRR